jgi:hypothetical protein
MATADPVPTEVRQRLPAQREAQQVRGLSGVKPTGGTWRRGAQPAQISSMATGLERGPSRSSHDAQGPASEATRGSDTLGDPTRGELLDRLTLERRPLTLGRLVLKAALAGVPVERRDRAADELGGLGQADDGPLSRTRSDTCSSTLSAAPCAWLTTRVQISRHEPTV